MRLGAHRSEARPQIDPDTLALNLFTKLARIADRKAQAIGAVGFNAQIKPERILINLVTNAIVHGQAYRVVIGVRHRAGGASIMVADNGHGLPGPARHLEGDAILSGPRARGRALPGFGFEIMQSLSVLGDLRLSVRSEPGHGVAAELYCPASQD